MKLVKLLEFPLFEEDGGELSVFESNISAIPFNIKRIFNVRSEKGTIRGKHAHRQCSQILICSNGSVEVACDDSVNKEIFILDKPNFGLLLSPGVWAEQRYLKNNSTMTVICDRLYEPEDYISNYDDFRVFANFLN